MTTNSLSLKDLTSLYANKNKQHISLYQSLLLLNTNNNDTTTATTSNTASYINTTTSITTNTVNNIRCIHDIIQQNHEKVNNLLPGNTIKEKVNKLYLSRQ